MTTTWNSGRTSRILFTALSLLAPAAASAHIVYATSFEPGQGMPGPLAGQDLWSNTGGPGAWRVSNQNPAVGIHNVTFNPANGLSASASRPTMHIQLDPILYWVALRLEANIRIDDLRMAADSSVRVSAANEVPGGVLQIGVENGYAVVTSGLNNAPLLIGPAIIPGQYAYVVAELDMFTGLVTAFLNDAPFGSFQLDIAMIHSLDSATGITMAADFDAGGTETVYMDSVRLWHVPTPATAFAFALAGLAARRRRA